MAKESTTKLMGILNATPDSFYEKSRSSGIEGAIALGKKMESDGADMIDIGGESSRPGAIPVAEEEEIRRVLPVIEALVKTISIPLSIDTCKPKVAQLALQAGATLINFTGFQSEEMRDIAASSSADICVMHMLQNPQTMQQDPFYPEGIIDHLLRWFESQLNCLTKAGISSQRIIFDPGIGFGKSVRDNITIINHLHVFKRLGCRLLVGTSRKSFMQKILGKPASELLSTTLAVNTIAIKAEVDIIRVHDVPEHRDIIDLLSYF
jgi:dihydropteroate synthase